MVSIMATLPSRQYGVRTPARKRDFLFSRSSRLASGITQLPTQWIRFFLQRGGRGVAKRSGSDVDHSFLSCAEVENEWRYNTTPPICLHGVDKDNFTYLHNPTDSSLYFKGSKSVMCSQTSQDTYRRLLFIVNYIAGDCLPFRLPCSPSFPVGVLYTLCHPHLLSNKTQDISKKKGTRNKVLRLGTLNPP
jgi:hypothetical protein